MSELTKKDIKEIVVEVVAPFADSVQKDFGRIDEQFSKVHERFDSVEERLDNVENRLDGVENRLGNVEKEVKWMRENSGELFAKLDKFIALYEESRQELRAMSNQLARFEERLIKLERHVGLNK